MALNYVLDQAFTLESVTVGIIERFEMRSKGQAIPEDHLGQFSNVITIVEEQIKKSPNGVIQRTAEYEKEFATALKEAMETLLEPSGKILHTYGMEKHLEDIEQLIRAFRILIETILADEEFFFKGTFGPYNVNQNFLLRHSKYYEQMTGLDADG